MMNRVPRFTLCALSLVLALFSVERCHAQDAELKRLWLEYEMHFLEPESHLALAKYFLDHGQRLQAFFISEQARRYRFEEKDFNKAFQLIFRGFDYGAAAEAALLKQLKDNPKSEELNFKLADLYIAREDWPKAKQYLSVARQLNPDDFKYVVGLAGVLDQEGNSREAERITKDFLDHHPESETTWLAKIEELIGKDAAKAKSLALEARTKFPKSASLAFDLGRIFQNEGKLEEAEKSFVEAAQLAPDSPDIQAWTGRFLLKVRVDKPRALEYYLNAYFLNPHTYDTEYAESRIAGIDAELAAEYVASQEKAGVAVEKLLNNSNADVVLRALAQVSANWKSDYLELVLKCLHHDDGVVRWSAMEILKQHVDRSFDSRLKALLTDDDLRVRGLALYIVVHLWKQDSFPTIEKMLREESELLRFDAYSALILEGGQEGQRMALAHAVNEKHPGLKQLLEKSKNEKDQP